MLCSIPSPCTPGSAQPAASGINVTTLYGMWCALGQTGLACSRRRSDLVYFSHSALKKLALLVGGAAAAAYSAVKMAHLDTALCCQQQGFAYVPLVAATTGAWDPAAAKVLQIIARAVAAREQVEAAAFFSEMLQETSVLIRSFRGRAALQRRADTALAEAPSHAASAAAVVLQS
ncbi:unnamed protein product [Durusdinium trenchii]|uniref:Uncharacterized protein n=2 Tax=Durusdinium trenchii TaxID=1381693 RepID=A0ABP0S6I3_9DINO